MKRFNLILTLLVCALAHTNISFAKHCLTAEGSIDEWGYITVVEDDFTYVFKYGDFKDYESLEKGYQFCFMWHSKDAIVPEVVEIPSTFKYQGKEYDVVAIANENVMTIYQYQLCHDFFPGVEELTFKTILIPKNIAIDTNFSKKSRYIPFFYLAQAENFEVEFYNDYLTAVNGVLMSIGENRIIRYPSLKVEVNYYIPEDVELLDYHSFENVKMPVFINEICKGAGALPAYPYYGLYDWTGVNNVGFFPRDSQIKAFDNIKVNDLWGDFIYPKTAVAGSFAVTDFLGRYLSSSFTELSVCLDPLYSSDLENKLEFIEFKNNFENITIVERLPDPDNPIACIYPEVYYPSEPDKREITTYVSADAFEVFKSAYEKHNYPQNAVIEKTKDILYLYPELCHGPWVNGQTQFIYGLCRFGNSELKSRKWSIDNESLATIDQTGVVTANAPGVITVYLTVTDNNDNEYHANKLIRINDSYISGIQEFNSTEATGLNDSGIFNLHGVRVSDTPDNLPQGLYIAKGKKFIKK